MYRILALDIDGTLLNSNKEITPAVRKAIENLQEKNIPILIVSGRPAQGIMHVADELGLKEKGGYILSYNGGKIINCKDNEVMYSSSISEELYKEICEYTFNMNASLLTYEGDFIITEKPDNPYVDVESRVVRMPVKKVDNMLERLDFPVDKFLLVGEPDYMQSQVERVAKHFQGRLNVFQSEPFFIEIVPIGIDKASSLDKLLSILGSKREELVACGDGLNDVTMIDYAGMGVAMENACKEVKEVSDYITSSCDEDGVAKAIYRFFDC